MTQFLHTKLPRVQYERAGAFLIGFTLAQSPDVSEKHKTLIQVAADLHPDAFFAGYESGQRLQDTEPSLPLQARR